MPNPCATDGTIDDLGVLVTAAFGLDRTWMEQGSCYGWGSQRPGQATPWQAALGSRVKGISGAELVNYALLICGSCPAQYDCASFAVEGMMIAGTWGMRITTLRWMQTQDDALDLIDMARDAQIPVQQIAAQTMVERSRTADIVCQP